MTDLDYVAYSLHRLINTDRHIEIFVSGDNLMNGPEGRRISFLAHNS